jgi:hypothetical protein
MINHAEKVDCGAIEREKLASFLEKTFSAESPFMPDHPAGNFKRMS